MNGETASLDDVFHQPTSQYNVWCEMWEARARRFVRLSKVVALSPIRLMLVENECDWALELGS